jgi:vacuolar-type H+-ATPase subunit H
MEILSLVDKLESYASASARLPGTHKVMIDSDRLLELVDQLRVAIPKDVRDSQGMLAQREAIINQSLLDARRIKASAEEESRNQVHQHTISQDAEVRAEEILADAKRRADALLQDSQRKAHDAMSEAQSFSDSRISESNRYATETLFRLEQQLASVLNAVRRGLDSLEEHQREKVA